MNECELHGAKSKSGWTLAGSIVLAWIPLCLWFAFLFSPMDEIGRPGWLTFMLEPWLLLLWLGFFVLHASALVAIPRLSVPWWAGALYASIGAVAINFGAFKLFTSESPYSSYPAFWLMTAVFVVVLIWTAFVILCNCIVQRWRGERISTNRPKHEKTDRFGRGLDDYTTWIGVVVTLLFWLAFQLTPMGKGYSVWILAVPHPWWIHISLMFILANGLFLFSIYCLANHNEPSALVALLVSALIPVGLGILLVPSSVHVFQFPAITILCATYVLVLSWSLAQLWRSRTTRKTHFEGVAIPTSADDEKHDPWSPSRQK